MTQLWRCDRPLQFLILKNIKNMKILNLIVTQAWFDEIMSGKKKQEFRDIKPTTQKRYCEVDSEGYCKTHNGRIVPRHYDAIRFCAGYRKDRDTAIVKIKKTQIDLVEDDMGNLITDYYKGEEYYAALAIYDLGEILESNIKK